uniref:Uncharacterized protein n=1 Tax=Vitis vinifera TaxID=29760 RepID=F6HM15_VITVI
MEAENSPLIRTPPLSFVSNVPIRPGDLLPSLYFFWVKITPKAFKERSYLII